MPNKTDAYSVGLDIGPTECKLVQIVKDGASFELKDWAIEPVKNGDITSAVRDILGSLKYPYDSVYTAVSGRGTLIRYISMPRMSFEDLRNSFEIEADKYFPFSRDQIYTDCYILDPQGKDKQMSVMVAASKKEIVDKRVSILSDIGVKTEFVGINPVALANAASVLGSAEKYKNECVAFLDLGESVSNLTVLIDGLPKFTRDIFVGGRDFTKRISNALEISFDEAEKLKINPKKELQNIKDACETSIMNIVQELKLSFDYLVTEKNVEISKLILTGGGSLVGGVLEALEKSLDMKVEKWDPLENIKLSDILPKNEITKKSFKLGVALGLALYEYD
ncbi:MAG: type IV pilus assembly protein PilM [Candidatus Zapsychrus exili]|nr:type IV pilus assembly protein PilM [Candidatus Zapsychrus exili]